MIGELLLVHLFTRRVVSYGWPRCMLSCRIFGVKETIEYLKGWSNVCLLIIFHVSLWASSSKFFFFFFCIFFKGNKVFH